MDVPGGRCNTGDTHVMCDARNTSFSKHNLKSKIHTADKSRRCPPPFTTLFSSDLLLPRCLLAAVSQSQCSRSRSLSPASEHCSVRVCCESLADSRARRRK